MVSVQALESSRPNGQNQVVSSGNAVIRELLLELALTLLPRGITPKTFSELSRYAFAYAAAKISQQSNRRVNYSRVAAITGLSRADVRRLLMNGDSVSSIGPSAQMPIERVLNGWRMDRRFVDKQGDPKQLKISDSPNSFALLVKLYGGDVPHRAILDELKRIGAVRREGNDVILAMKRVPRPRDRFASLSSVLPALVDGIRLASASNTSRTTRSIYRLTVPAKSDLDVSIVRERCMSTVTAMLNGLEESLGGQLSGSRSKKAQQCSFVVTVLLAENRANGFFKPTIQAGTRRPRRAVKKVRKA
jgi:Family of unknown function (DUF6502)